MYDIQITKEKSKERERVDKHNEFSAFLCHIFEVLIAVSAQRLQQWAWWLLWQCPQPLPSGQKWHQHALDLLTFVA